MIVFTHNTNYLFVRVFAAELSGTKKNYRNNVDENSLSPYFSVTFDSFSNSRFGFRLPLFLLVRCPNRNSVINFDAKKKGEKTEETNKKNSNELCETFPIRPCFSTSSRVMAFCLICFNCGNGAII